MKSTLVNRANSANSANGANSKSLALQLIALGGAAVAMTASWACSSATGTGFDNNDGGPAMGSDGGPIFGGDAYTGDGYVPSLGDGATGPDVQSMPGKTILYAHDKTSLYSIDPASATLAATMIGKFDCIGGTGQPTSMTDIAVDKDGKLYGVGTSTLYLNMTISGTTVQCTAGAVPITGGGTKAKFYGMSFAPVGTLDPANETLVVGNTDGELYQVNTTSGALTLVGIFGLVPAKDPPGNTYAAANVGKKWEMSGDIVFLANNGNPIGFATLRDCPTPPSTTGCNTTDTLAQIDLAKMKAGDPAGVVVRGQILKAASCTDTNTGYGGMYGIAAFQDKVIGFSHKGDTVSIDNNLGTACLIAGSQPLWDGAGVTTTAPVVAPPPVIVK